MNYTYRIYPTPEQQALMFEWLDTCRHLYYKYPDKCNPEISILEYRSPHCSICIQCVDKSQTV